MQVFVFIARTCSVEAANSGASQLTDADRYRAQEMGSEKRRSEFVSGRLLLRQSLTAAYGDRGKAWTWEAQPSGALSLRAIADVDTPAISLSHSHGRVACGLADASALGVDVELIRSRTNIAALAEQILHPDEMQQFVRLDIDAKMRLFYEKWALKEALGKALGCGINYPMRDFLLDEGRLIKAPKAWVPDTAGWSFSHTLLDGGYALGLAWEGEAAEHVLIKTVEIKI